MKNMFLTLTMMLLIGCSTIVASGAPVPTTTATTAVTLDNVYGAADPVVIPAADDTASVCCRCLALLCCPVTTVLVAATSTVVYPCVACKVYLLKDQTIPVIPSCCMCNMGLLTNTVRQNGCCLGMMVACCPCFCCDLMCGCKAYDYMTNVSRSIGESGIANAHRRKMQRQLAEEEAAGEPARYQPPAQDAAMQ